MSLIWPYSSFDTTIPRVVPCLELTSHVSTKQMRFILNMAWIISIKQLQLYSNFIHPNMSLPQKPQTFYHCFQFLNPLFLVASNIVSSFIFQIAEAHSINAPISENA